MTVGPRLDLPDDLKLFAEGVVLDREQGDEVLGTVAGRRAAVTGGQGAFGNLRNASIGAAERVTSWPCSGELPGEATVMVSP